MNQDPKPTAEDVAAAEKALPCITYDARTDSGCCRVNDELAHDMMCPWELRPAIALALARVRGERDDAWASENAETARIAHELRDTLEDVISDRADLQAKLDAQAAVIGKLVAALELTVAVGNDRRARPDVSLTGTLAAALESAAALGYGKSGEVTP